MSEQIWERWILDWQWGKLRANLVNPAESLKASLFASGTGHKLEAFKGKLMENYLINRSLDVFLKLHTFRSLFYFYISRKLEICSLKMIKQRVSGLQDIMNGWQFKWQRNIIGLCEMNPEWLTSFRSVQKNYPEIENKSKRV